MGPEGALVIGQLVEAIYRGSIIFVLTISLSVAYRRLGVSALNSTTDYIYQCVLAGNAPC